MKININNNTVNNNNNHGNVWIADRLYSARVECSKKRVKVYVTWNVAVLVIECL